MAGVPSIDVLTNNAGIMAPEFKLSPDGYESQVAIDQLGPLSTNFIMDKILASKSPRIVNASSDGHRLNPIRWANHNLEVSASERLADL